MITIEEIVRQLAADVDAMRALIQAVSDNQAQWKPGPDIWSIRDVMEHVYNEERIDFRKHLMEMLADPPQPWGGFRRAEYIHVDTCRQALESFIIERQNSIAWLKALGSTDWDTTSQATFGPAEEVMTFSAGDVLVSWVAHDYLHIRQINELLYAWNLKQAAPYAVDYAGGW